LISLDDALAMPLRDAQSFFNIGNSFTYLMAQADDINTVTETSKAIKTRLGSGYIAVSQEQAQNSVEAVTGTISAVLGGIAAISLIVAGVGIINTMTVSVMERTREIGVLKALGSKSRDVLLMFLTEAVLTGIIGGTTGALLGFGLGSLVGGIVGVQASISVIIGVEVVGFSIVVSALSGMYPAWRASQLNPVEALRSE
jgi:putative ABC transport system permease protein